MKIQEFRKETFIDYPGKIASIIFVPGCNFACPACHAKEIVEGKGKIPEQEIFNYLDFAKGFIDAVVLCGGEPTLQQDLPEFAARLKERGLAVKLDTNGSNPQVLEKLLQENLIDCVAMDVKAPQEKYDLVTGIQDADLQNMEISMQLVQQFPAYEFRTTVPPIIFDGKIKYMGIGNAVDIARWIKRVTGNNQHIHYLQPFVARSKDEMMDERLSIENLSSLGIPVITLDDLLQNMQDAVSGYLPNCRIR